MLSSGFGYRRQQETGYGLLDRHNLASEYTYPQGPVGNLSPVPRRPGQFRPIHHGTIALVTGHKTPLRPRLGQHHRDTKSNTKRRDCQQENLINPPLRYGKPDEDRRDTTAEDFAKPNHQLAISQGGTDSALSGPVVKVKAPKLKKLAASSRTYTQPGALTIESKKIETIVPTTLISITGLRPI